MLVSEFEAFDPLRRFAVCEDHGALFPNVPFRELSEQDLVKGFTRLLYVSWNIIAQ